MGRGTQLTEYHIITILSDICDCSTLMLKVLDLSRNKCVERVETGLLARALTRLNVVYLNDTHLTVEQVIAISTQLCDSSTLTLKVLDLSANSSVSRVEPRLLARAVTRLKEVNV